MAKIEMKYNAVLFILDRVSRVLFNCSSVTSSLGKSSWLAFARVNFDFF